MTKSRFISYSCKRAQIRPINFSKKYTRHNIQSIPGMLVRRVVYLHRPKKLFVEYISIFYFLCLIFSIRVFNVYTHLSCMFPIILSRWFTMHECLSYSSLTVKIFIQFAQFTQHIQSPTKRYFTFTPLLNLTLW